jgi:DNA-directed RNA polymerase subunit RPC12/RpoP
MREHGAFPLAPITRPEILWPSEAHKAPARCEYCGARLLLSHAPTAYSRVEVTCMQCARVCADLISDLTPRRLTPDEWRALPGNQSKSGRPKNQTETAPKRLVRILEQADHPMPSLALAALLGTSENAARNAIAAARYGGAKIVWTKCGYVLEGVTS